MGLSNLNSRKSAHPNNRSGYLYNFEFYNYYLR